MKKFKLKHIKSATKILKEGTKFYGEGKCDGCGKTIGKKLYNKNDGLCEDCKKGKELLEEIL